jgi:uncharacterized membrane protein
MTEETNAAPAGASDTQAGSAAKPAAPAGTSNDEVTVVSAVVADEQGILAEETVVAQGDHALVVARFANKDAAISIYDLLLEGELDGLLHIDGVLVVNADNDGRIHVQKMTDHSTRTGLKWGIVGGVVAAVFLPATLLAGAVALGTAGAAAGKARNLARRLDTEHELAGVITPGTSGILALVTAEDAPEVEEKMTDAEEVKTVPVDEETAAVIKEAAKEAEATTPSGV